MKATTHQRAGLLCGLMTHPLFIAPFYAEVNDFSRLFMISLFCLSTTIGSLLPDIDIPGSQIGKFFPLFSRFLSRNFKHRTLTHSLLSLALLYGLLMQAPALDAGKEFFQILVLGLLVGHATHIFLDMLTSQGVSLFYPLQRKIRLGNLKTGSRGEKLIDSLLTLSLTLYFVNLFLN